SLFFLDAILTIIISSISASDVTMLLLPELAPYRIVLAEAFAFFIMVVLVALGPKRAVPIFLIGGGAFTLFTIIALSIVGSTAIANPEWAFLTEGIVSRLQSTGVVEEVIRSKENLSAISNVVFFQLFFRSMSSAMLGFSGYEVIPASGKHAARPKWKVINTALTLAAVFLIGTGIVQLIAAQQWNIPATEGYSTLLIEYEINAVQTFGNGLTPEDINVTNDDLAQAELFYEAQAEEHAGEQFTDLSESQFVEEAAYNIAVARAIQEAIAGTPGQTFLVIAGTLLAIILLLAQGGGYIGGAAVAANAARLGRLPSMFADDRMGIAVIWAISAVLIPIIREVVIVESYYAFGFVSAFVITSTTVYFVRHDAMRQRGIEPGSAEAKSLRFAGLRGMIASYFMMAVLITQKTDALWVIAIFGITITLFQYFVANGGLKRRRLADIKPAFPLTKEVVDYSMGVQRAHDEARQRGIVDIVNELIQEGAFNKFNVGPDRIRELICYLYNLDTELLHQGADHHDGLEEPSADLEETYKAAYSQRDKILEDVEHYSHFGIFTFIHNYHINWVAEEHGRDAAVVTKAMLNILFPQTEHPVIWKEFSEFKARTYPEPIWQFSRRRYHWAKDQWPNLSDRITTIWTLQDFGLIDKNINVETIIAVADGKKQVLVKIPSNPKEDDDQKMHKETIEEISDEEVSDVSDPEEAK
ncbi:hypothetical protein MNBD_CHLOROFLEXI01-3820, partial [hydrothermal vent metagenome]